MHGMKINSDNARRLLFDLLALPTVNPMGKPYRGDEPVERPVVDYLARLFGGTSAAVSRQACGDFHESLLVEVPGRCGASASLFESHIDTVGAEDWADRAFAPRVEGDRVFGRGACDDKGSLAAMVLALADLLASGERPPETVVLLAAGDEECGQTGIKRFAATCGNVVRRGIFGEPTSCLPVIQHKGTIRWDITVRGRSAHSSQPEMGASAIRGMVRVLERLDETAASLSQRYASPLMSGPTLTVTMIQGGRARNIVPDCCTAAVDFRVLPEMDMVESSREVQSAVDSLRLATEHSPFQCFAPPLATRPDDVLACTAAAYCTLEFGRPVAASGVPYGSDASYMPHGNPAIVLGPGSIDVAHAIDEYVDLGEVVRSARIYRRLMVHDWSRAEAAPC